ncbi:MAG: hypothetical protein COX07_02980 [Bacteroidetes bacterium CG23_combo_of_CG06-09_8_20_14_all_32_9]|nr:MAG: hypothetical protein COX07_02980 [Bacteroidetes bacterium CG23_combo_of_CG06-09_8_20_14_all_32_9]
MNKVNRNTSLTELKRIENISVRSFNICWYFNLRTVGDLLSFFEKKRTFITLKNCGIKSEAELVAICKKYKNYLKYMKTPEKDIDEFFVKIHNLTIQQESILNNLIVIKLRNLSTRAFNALIKYLDNDITITSFYKRIFSHINFSFYNIKNVGVGTVPELIKLQKEILELINSILSFRTEQELIKECFHSILIKYYQIQTNHYSEITSIFSKIGKFPIFKTLQILIDNDYIFNKEIKIIFKFCMNYFNKGNFSKLINQAKILNLSRERVRQKRKFLYENFSNYFVILKDIDIRQTYLYDIDLNQPYIAIDNELVENINKTEDVNFNLLFINKMLSVVTQKTHSLIGNERYKVLHIRKRFMHNWNETYLISNKLSNIFDFTQFVEDLEKHLKGKIRETYWLNFNQYLLQFYKSKSILKINLISEICEKILFREFSLVLDSKKNILFKRNTLKTLPDYIIELLEKKGHPLTVYEMFNILKKQIPERCKSIEVVRSSYHRIAKDKIMCFGRTSTYGLKEWEKTNRNIKGGTIRKISKEYLNKFNKPKHINEIAKYVIRFRPTTNAKSIISNLKVDNSNWFVFYKNKYVGLKDKNYIQHYKKIALKKKYIINPLNTRKLH